MKKLHLTISALSLLMILSVSVFAQKRVYFCEDYTATGEPKGQSSRWSITPAAGNVYFLYQNDNINITTSKIYFFIDFLTDGEYKEFDTKSVTPDKYKSYVLYDYKFTKSGDYRIIVYDADMSKLTTDYVTITMKDAEKANNTDNTKVSTVYYLDATVTFCTDVDNKGNAVTPSTVFNINQDKGSYVYVLLNNGKALKTTELIVDIWKGDDYKDFVETRKVTVEDYSNFAYFKYTFYKDGKYKFSIFTKDETFIQTGFVEVNYK